MANNEINEARSLLNLLDPTFRALLVDLAFADTLDWRDTNAANFDLFSAETDALFDLCDLSLAQFKIVAAAAYAVAEDR
jgi:hypothetical protein